MSTAMIVAALSILGGDGPKGPTRQAAVAARDGACVACATACAEHAAPRSRAKSEVEVEISAFEPDPKTIATAVDLATRFLPRLNAREVFELAQKLKLADGKLSISCDLGIAQGKATVKVIPRREEAAGIEPIAKAVELAFEPTRAPAASNVKDEPGPASKPEAVEAWPLTLRDAITIGIENSEVVRVVAFGAQYLPGTEPDVRKDGSITVARLNRDAGMSNFRSAMMAHDRSIQQQYWALSYQHDLVKCRQVAVKLVEEIVRAEKTEIDGAVHPTTADLAEAVQNLENCKLALQTAESDLATTERQLRNILGLPPADNRRIVPTTVPTEAKVDPDWTTSLAAMLANQPDIVQQRELVEKAVTVARHSEELAKAEPRLVVDVDPDALAKVAKAASYQAGRQKTFYQQIVRQTTHSLARFFHEVGFNYKNFQTARGLRQAAEVRLQAARAYYDEGRAGFTVDRLLDAVNQHANALAQESQLRATYNTALVALEEAKGTLLEYDKIVVAEPPAPGPSVAAKAPVDDAVKAASHDGPTMPKPVPPAAVQAVGPTPAPAAGSVITYQVQVQNGTRTIKFEGTVTTSPGPVKP